MSDGTLPVAMQQSDLANLLEEMARLVRSGDSLEGSLEYLIPGPEDGPQDPWALMVRAGYRYGNREYGQGFFRLIGRPGRPPVETEMPPPEVDLDDHPGDAGAAPHTCGPDCPNGRIR